jgi:hypothetical protein
MTLRACKEESPVFAGGFLLVGGTGLEPVTPSLSSWFRDPGVRGRTLPNARSRAGLRGISGGEVGRPPRSCFGRLAREWPAVFLF